MAWTDAYEMLPDCTMSVYMGNGVVTIGEQTNLFHFANGEPEAKVIFFMQELQQLTVYSVLNGVHHLRLSHDCSPFLFYPGVQELCLKCNLCQYI